jgi:hypothetical protein
LENKVYDKDQHKVNKVELYEYDMENNILLECNEYIYMVNNDIFCNKYMENNDMLYNDRDICKEKISFLEKDVWINLEILC